MIGLGRLSRLRSVSGCSLPVALDEFHHRGMIVVAVHHLAALGPVRDDQRRDTRTITKEIERYEGARIPQAASLVEGDEQHRVFLLIHVQLVHDLLDHRLEKIELRACRVPVDQAVGLHVRDRRQLAVLERIEEVDRVLDVRLALPCVSHDCAGIAEGVADIAVVLGDEKIDRIPRAVRHPHRCVVAAAVVCPGNFLLIERVPDVAQCRGRDLGTAQDVGCIDRAVRQEAGAHVVDHVEVTGIAIRRRMPGQACQIRHDRCDAGLSDIRAVSPRRVARERHIRRRLRVRIRHARCRRLAHALERLPEDVVGRPDHLVLDGGTAHDRLVIVVIEGVPVREALEHRCVALLNIQERHRVAARAVVARDAHERIQVIEAAGRVVRGRIHHVAVRLLPHVEKAMHHIADIAVVRPGGTAARGKGRSAMSSHWGRAYRS